jgi:hypothetical protein
MSETDYSATIIYKITCKDESNKDIYVGHTVNFVKRKYSHRYACTHADHPQYNSKVYTVIRENGGWDNWRMKLIHAFDCKNLYEAREKEQEYYVLLKATLNSIEPLKERKIKETKKEKIKPISTPPIDNIANDIETSNKKHICLKCKYDTNRLSQYTRHLDTKKHLLINKDNSDIKHVCKICTISYATRSGLWRHKRVCKGEKSRVNKTVVSDKLTMAEMFEEYKKTNELYKKEHNYFQQQLLELNAQLNT